MLLMSASCWIKFGLDATAQVHTHLCDVQMKEYKNSFGNALLQQQNGEKRVKRPARMSNGKGCRV